MFWSKNYAADDFDPEPISCAPTPPPTTERSLDCYAEIARTGDGRLAVFAGSEPVQYVTNANNADKLLEQWRLYFQGAHRKANGR